VVFPVETKTTQEEIAVVYIFGKNIGLNRNQLLISAQPCFM
jgi:hypothetical protein